MAGARFDLVLAHARRLATRFEAAKTPDRQLLSAFVQNRDEESFTALVHRHGPMVLGVCRRLLRDSADAEDAFQTTFFVLARKAAAIRDIESTGSWLHGVALRSAHKCRVEQARRRRRERQYARTELAETADSMTWGELRGVLDDELGKMDRSYRAPLILCLLEGRTQDEAAQQLGWSKSTLRRRLERGRSLMQRRLTRRGITLSAGLATAWLAESASSASVPMFLAKSTVLGAVGYGTGQAIQGGIGPQVVVLTKGVLQAMLFSKLQFASVLFLAMSMLVLGGGLVAYRTTAADHPQQVSQAGGEKGSPAAPAQEKPAAEGSALSGRIVDETGAPVTDAQIELTCTANHQRVKSKTDNNGRYEFKEVNRVGEYEIEIASQRWVGIIRPNPLPRIQLNPPLHTVRDFELQRACQLRIRTVNEEGQPIRDVQIYYGLMTDDPMRVGISRSTDKQGWATLGGLKPTAEIRFVATMSKDYGFARIDVTLDDPAVVTERTIVLHRGKEVKGVVLCSDGKPAAGWRMIALPTWWRLGVSPSGAVIGPDGSFTLPHIVPDTYNLTVSIPVGPTMSTPRPVLSGAALPSADGKLAVTLDYPSPGSLSLLSGRIQFTGGSLQQGFHISARSSDGKYQGDDYLEPGKQEFRLGPLPPGSYKIEFNSREIEPFEHREVQVPCEKLDVKLKVFGGDPDPPPQNSWDVRVVNEAGKPVQDLVGMIYTSEHGYRTFRQGTGGTTMGLALLLRDNETADFVLMAEGYAPTVEHLTVERLNELRKRSPGELPITMRKGGKVELRFRLPSGAEWPKEATAEAFFDVRRERGGKLGQPANQGKGDPSYFNILPGESIGPGRYEIRLAKETPAFYVRIHVDDIRLGMGPFSLADVKNGVLEIAVPKL
jgi:RNA polymerase sigma factor (sigma-70 family)